MCTPDHEFGSPGRMLSQHKMLGLHRWTSENKMTLSLIVRMLRIFVSNRSYCILETGRGCERSCGGFRERGF